MPPLSRETSPTHHQDTIMEILPPPDADDAQHHIQFISLTIGTMIRVICSTFLGVETASPTAKVLPSLDV